MYDGNECGDIRLKIVSAFHFPAMSCYSLSFSETVLIIVKMTATDFEDMSCEMVYGQMPPPLEDDPALQQPCFAALCKKHHTSPLNAHSLGQNYGLLNTLLCILHLSIWDFLCTLSTILVV